MKEYAEEWQRKFFYEALRLREETGEPVEPVVFAFSHEGEGENPSLMIVSLAHLPVKSWIQAIRHVGADPKIGAIILMGEGKSVSEEDTPAATGAAYLHNVPLDSWASCHDVISSTLELRMEPTSVQMISPIGSKEVRVSEAQNGGTISGFFLEPDEGSGDFTFMKISCDS